MGDYDDRPGPSDLRRSDTRSSSAAWALNQSTAGERISTKTPRGVHKPKKGETRPDPSAIEISWLPMIQSALQYDFRNPDLLEEALESPGSGIVCVGSSNRVCIDGNAGLARVGEGVLRAVAEDLGYLLKIHAKDVDPAIKSLLSTSNLAKTGRKIGIDKFIRPRAPLSEKQKKNPLSKVVGQVDKERLVAQGVKAVVAAVYYDGGYVAAKAVLGVLGLVILGPE